MRYASKTDANQSAIVDELRRVGASVESLHRVGKDIPDLLVGFRGQNYLIEIKAPGGATTPGQRMWHATWSGQCAVVTTADEAMRVIGAI